MKTTSMHIDERQGIAIAEKVRADEALMAQARCAEMKKHV